MKYLSVVLFLSLFGCSSFKDISNSRPLPLNLRLDSVMLKGSAFLCEDTLGFFKPEINAELSLNYGSEKCQGSQHLLSIPNNASVDLVKLVTHTGYGLFIVKRWYVIGRYTHNESQYDFVYLLPWIQDLNGQFIAYDELPWVTDL